MIKFLSFVFICTLVITTAHSRVSIITDLDDTVKITNAGDLVEASVNGVFTTSIYTGMDDFLIESKKEGDNDQLHVVSATPAPLKPRVRALLRKHSIEADSLALRNVLRERTPAFKKRVIRNILAQSSDEFILIGDDVNEDPNIYAEIAKEFPERIKAIYIHVIRGKTLPEQVTPYWTSFDLSLREFLAGRLPLSAVLRAGSSILSQTKPQRIFPKFSKCPSDRAIWHWQNETEASELATKVIEKIIKFCQVQSV